MKPKTHPTKKMVRYYSSPIPACFRPPSSTTTPALEYHHPPPRTTITTTTPNLTTSLYQTHLGLFSLTWSRSLLARTLHLHLHPSSCSTPSSPSSSSSAFNLTIKPFVFWNKRGVKNFPLDIGSTHMGHILVYWDFINVKFGSGPEPESGYYIAIVSDSEHILFVGDMENEFNSRILSKKHSNIVVSKSSPQSLVVRREHVCGNKYYTTRTDLGGISRVISIELNNDTEDDPRLLIKFDSKIVVKVKHLKWKFRGSERVEVDGHKIQLSWDVYNWLFEEDANHDEGYALFTFRFEKTSNEVELVRKSSDDNGGSGRGVRKERVMMWSQDSCGLSYERKKMKKKLLVKTRSSSSSSLSSASSSGSSSVMEWESVEENELKGPTGFSLLVYAWKG